MPEFAVTSIDIPIELSQAVEQFWAGDSAAHWILGHNSAWGTRPLDVYHLEGLEAVVQVAQEQSYGTYF